MAYSPDLSIQTCAGTIISDKHILTSAACAPFDVTIYVHLGDTILGNDKDVNYNKTILVKNITRHPNYLANRYPAILEMEEPVPLDQYPNIKPVCLPDQGADFSRFRADFTETTATVTGWGYNDLENSTFNSWLHELQVTVFADEECDPSPTSSQLCAGVLEGSEAPCVGDDGGPLVVSDPNVNNNGLTLAGIVGFDNDCNSLQTYTKVSMFRDWIDEIIGDATTCPPPPSTTPPGCNNCEFPFKFGDATFDTCISVQDVDTQSWCSYSIEPPVMNTPIKIPCSESDSTCPSTPPQTIVTSQNYPLDYPNNADEVK